MRRGYPIVRPALNQRPARGFLIANANGGTQAAQTPAQTARGHYRWQAFLPKILPFHQIGLFRKVGPGNTTVKPFGTGDLRPAVNANIATAVPSSFPLWGIFRTRFADTGKQCWVIATGPLVPL